MDYVSNENDYFIVLIKKKKKEWRNRKIESII